MEQPISMDALYESIIGNFNDGVYCVDLERRIFYWSKTAERITGYTAEEMIGKCCFDSHLDHVDIGRRPLCNLMCPLVGTMFDGKRRQEQVFLKHKEGHRVPVIVHTYPLYKGDTLIGATEIFQEYLLPSMNDERIDGIMSMPMHDPLTGLATSGNLNMVLNHEMDMYHRYKQAFLVVMVDLDHFDAFNEHYGKENGDELLRKISTALSDNIRGQDIAGRWQADRFMLIFSNAFLNDQDSICEKILRWVNGCAVTIDGLQMHVTASVGSAAVRVDDNVSDLVGRCEKLLFEAKNAGGNCARITGAY